jgi:hypothetical protein
LLFVAIYTIMGRMITLPTAKALLFIALTLGPSHPRAIYATSNSESYLWTATDNGWTLDALGFPAADRTRNPTMEQSFIGSPTQRSMPDYLHDIANHDWSKDGVAVLSNGNRIEKKGKYLFYIVNAGGANEKDFTISIKPRDD